MSQQQGQRRRSLNQLQIIFIKVALLLNPLNWNWKEGLNLVFWKWWLNPDSFSGPPDWLLGITDSVSTALVDPWFEGFDHIPRGEKLIFISNHCLMSADLPTFLSRLYLATGVFPRGCADFMHKYMPYWPFFQYLGAVDGTRHACSQVLDGGDDLLIYPGGAREVFRRTKDDANQLFWNDRTGFARLALDHGATIIPVSVVGPNDMLSVVFDIPIRFIMGRDLTFPVVFPNSLQRSYYKFGPPIRAAEFGVHWDDSAAAEKLRDHVQNTVLSNLTLLKKRQLADPHRFRPLGQALISLLGALTGSSPSKTK